MKKLLFNIIPFLSLVLFACGNRKNHHATTLTPAVAIQKTNTNNLLTDTKTLSRAEEQLKQLLQQKGKNLVAFEDIRFYQDGRIKIGVLDPGQPDGVFEYTYKKGEWSSLKQPTDPATIYSQRVTYSLDKVKFERVATVYLQTLEKAVAVEGAILDPFVLYSRETAGWQSGFGSRRTKYAASFTADGTLQNLQKI